MEKTEYPNLNGYYINFQLLTQKLKEIAQEKGMTQSELAAGITPRDHLNKILNGKRNPSLELLYQLCNKLRVDIRVLIEQCYYINFEQTSDYMHQMKQCTTMGNYDLLEQLLQKCANLPDFQYGVGKQAYTDQQGVVQLKKYKNAAKALEYFNEALRTFSLMDETGSERLHIFTIEEIGINTDKATCLFTLGQRQEAIELLTTSVESRLANYENVETLHILRAYFYLAQFYLQEKNYVKCIEIATKGINLSNCKFVYIYAGDLNATKATALHFLGDEEHATFHFRRAYEFYNLLGSSRISTMLDRHLEIIGFDKNKIKYDVTHPIQ